MREYSEELAELIKEFLAEDNWNYDFNEDEGNFSFSLTIDSKLKHLRYYIHVHGEAYTVYAVSPLNADNDDKPVMSTLAEFICRANYGLRNGNFELDMRDGEIRYKIFVDCEDSLPSQAIVKRSIVIPCVMFEKYSRGILDVMFKGLSSEEAVSECENA